MSTPEDLTIDEATEDYLRAMRGRGHTLRLDDDGSVDLFASAGGTHNGPGCSVCQWARCMWCTNPEDIPQCTGAKPAAPPDPRDEQIATLTQRAEASEALAKELARENESLRIHASGEISLANLRLKALREVQINNDIALATIRDKDDEISRLRKIEALAKAWADGVDFETWCDSNEAACALLEAVSGAALRGTP